jgi:adenine-specific DNA-methyltransferase
MKGFVPTPDYIVDLMVEKLFNGVNVMQKDLILDPGCGTGAFIEGIIRWCIKNENDIPRIVGIESDPTHIPVARKKFSGYSSVEIRQEDFLATNHECYDFVIGNPPYIPITKLSEEEKTTYKSQFLTARNRFDLYQLFFEQSLRNLKNNGRLVFITPEKYLYVDSASALRVLLGKRNIQELHMVSEQTFGDLTTYPMITTLINRPSRSKTKIILRDGKNINVKLPKDGRSWLPSMYGMDNEKDGFVLEDITLRVSCGVATGADSVFVKKTKDLDRELIEYAYPTISGKQLTPGHSLFTPEDSMIIPYRKNGQLIPEDKLGYLKKYLSGQNIIDKLKSRTCVTRKPWYAFHENPPLQDILKPKILCKDITIRPYFWVDKDGTIVPRHSTYYIIPNNPEQLEALCDYLNSKEVYSWLEANSQRAANGFLRLQSNILKRIPINNNIYASISTLSKSVARESGSYQMTLQG